jgi:hypothetical protein
VVAPSARAQTSAGAEPIEVAVEIERAPGSEACPNKDAVFQAIQRLFPEYEFRQGGMSSLDAARARVAIRPLLQGHEARITLLAPAHGERVIHEQDEDCRGLADALALAFVMLVAPPVLESESGGDAPSLPQSATPPLSPKMEAQDNRHAPGRAPEAARPEKSYQAALAGSFVVGSGLLSEPALGGAGEAELFHRRGFGLSLQGLRLWARPAVAEGGSVRLTLWGVVAGPCYRQPVGAIGVFDGCLRFGIGSQHADVQGFADTQSGNFPWQVLLPSASVRFAPPSFAGFVGVFARAGLVVQLRPQSFSVRQADGSEDNLQVASAPKFGLMTEIGLTFGTGPF